MRKKNKNLLIGLFILLLVSAALILGSFGNVSADRKNDIGRGASSAMVAEQHTDDGEKGMDKAPPGLPENGSMTFLLLKLVAALVVVVVAIYGFLYVLKRMMGPRFSGNRKSRVIDVMETVYIAQKRSISLVRFHDRAILVGVSDNNIQPLAQLDSEETAKVLAAYNEAKPAPGFKNILGDAREKLKAWNMTGVRLKDTARDAKRPQTA